MNIREAAAKQRETDLATEDRCSACRHTPYNVHEYIRWSPWHEAVVKFRGCTRCGIPEAGTFEIMES